MCSCFSSSKDFLSAPLNSIRVSGSKFVALYSPSRLFKSLPKLNFLGKLILHNRVCFMRSYYDHLPLEFSGIIKQIKPRREYLRKQRRFITMYSILKKPLTYIYEKLGSSLYANYIAFIFLFVSFYYYFFMPIPRNTPRVPLRKTSKAAVCIL